MNPYSWTFVEIMEALKPFAEKADQFGMMSHLPKEGLTSCWMSDCEKARIVFLKLGGKL